MDVENSNLTVIRRYLNALESGQAGEALAQFFVEDAIQIEFPNKLNPDGQKSDLASIMQRSIQGKNLLSEQRYTINTELARDNRVAIEANWTGTLAVPIATLAAGEKMDAFFAMFFELKDGRIVRQHNYDCFENW